MPRQTYDGFSLVIPDGWIEVLEEEGTFSDTTEQLPPLRIAAEGEGRGSLIVSAQRISPDDGVDGEELARDWGARRGLGAPLSIESRPWQNAILCTAVYQLRKEFVELWYLTGEATLLHASYVCPWDARDDEKAAREAAIASLRFA